RVGRRIRYSLLGGSKREDRGRHDDSDGQSRSPIRPRFRERGDAGDCGVKLSAVSGQQSAVSGQLSAPSGGWKLLKADFKKPPSPACSPPVETGFWQTRLRLPGAWRETRRFRLADVRFHRRSSMTG